MGTVRGTRETACHKQFRQANMYLRMAQQKPYGDAGCNKGAAQQVGKRGARTETGNKMDPWMQFFESPSEDR